MTGMRLQLAPVIVNVARWSMNINVISFVIFVFFIPPWHDERIESFMKKKVGV